MDRCRRVEQQGRRRIYLRKKMLIADSDNSHVSTPLIHWKYAQLTTVSQVQPRCKVQICKARAKRNNAIRDWDCVTVQRKSNSSHSSVG